MALFTEPLWVALLGLIHTKYQKGAGLVDYKLLKNTHCTVVCTVNRTHCTVVCTVNRTHCTVVCTVNRTHCTVVCTVNQTHCTVVCTVNQTHCTVVCTVNQTHCSTQNILCSTMALSRIGNHLRCTTAYSNWKCIAGRALSGIKLCTDVRTQIETTLLQSGSLPPPTHAMTPTPLILQAISKQHVIPVYILQLHSTRMHPPAMPFNLFKK